MIWSLGIPPKVAFLCSEALDNVLTWIIFQQGEGDARHIRDSGTPVILYAHLHLGFIPVSV